MADKSCERTAWEVRTYDVWGNAEDGWNVNDSFVVDSFLLLELPVASAKLRTPWDQDFTHYRHCEISTMQICDALNCHGVIVDIDGDDTHITVSRRKDAYPIGELYCISHKSLNPIRPRANVA